VGFIHKVIHRLRHGKLYFFCRLLANRLQYGRSAVFVPDSELGTHPYFASSGCTPERSGRASKSGDQDQGQRSIPQKPVLRKRSVIKNRNRTSATKVDTRKLEGE